MAKTEDIMLDLLKEVRDEQKHHTHILIKMEVDVEQNKEGLQEHMAQTRVVKSMVVDNKKESDARLESLEKPSIVAGELKKYFFGLGAAAGVLATVMKAVGYF